MYQLPILCSIICMVLRVSCQTDDLLGRVFIGTDENDTDTTAISFSENYAGSPDFYVPVYVGVYNSSTGEPIQDFPNDRVLITCGFEGPRETGLTDATFDTQIIFIQNNYQAKISFLDVKPGRPSLIQCWGNSQPPGLFQKESSISETISFEIRPRGMAHILEPVFTVPNTDIASYKVEFVAQLTETVEINNITLSCESNSSAAGSMELLIPTRNVLIGSDRSIMEVTVTSKGNGISYVYCIARSENNGLQFLGERGRQSIFLIEESEVSLIPVTTDLFYPKMVAYLVLDAEPKSGIVFYCNLTIVDTVEEAISIQESSVCEIPDDLASTRAPVPTGTSTTTQAPVTGSTTTTNAPVNTTGFWELTTSTVEFIAEDSRYKAIQITRTNRYQPVTPELIVVRCCAPDEPDTDPKYKNTSAAFLAVAYLSEEKSINWTIATVLNDLELETEVINPAYVELAPCPCDVTSNLCDVDCCCDSDCTAEDNAVFTCTPGLQGGLDEDDAQYKCTSDFYKKPDWFTLMCVEIENSGFLGYYRLPQVPFRDFPGYVAVRNNFVPYSYRDTSDRFDDDTAEALDPYKEGFAVKTGIRSSTSSSSIYVSNYFRLTLPQRTLTGSCVTSSPVQYLKETTNTCVHEMREEICSKFSVLSALIYVQSTGVWENQAAPQVLKGNMEAVIGFTNVNYFCLTEEETLAYISKVTRPSDIYTSDKRYKFDESKDNFTDCSFDQLTSAYLCEELIFEPDNVTMPQYTRCTWDDGFTQPPFPVYESSLESCQNAVLDVVYNFTWKGSEIDRLDATMLLGSIPMFLQRTDSISIKYVDSAGNTVVNSTNVTSQYTSQLTQTFTATWHHKFSDSSSTDDEAEDQPAINVIKRSGNPGYDFGLPIFSGVEYRNETTDDFLYIDTNLSKSITMWSPSSSGLCEGSGRTLVDFGVNAKSSCAMRLSLDDLRDCDNLRKLILLNQDSLMLSNYISYGGNPNQANLTDWVPVFRQDISSIIGESLPNDTADSTTIDYQTTATATADTTSRPATTQQITTAIEDIEANLTFSYLDNVIGRCPNIPSNIHIDIMYGLVGKSNFTPIYEILGAKISYSLNEWKLYCVGKDGSACYSDPSWIEATDLKVQTFTLSSSVNFIEVPPSKPTPLSEYETRQRVNSASHNLCYQDACWEEIIYPLTEAYTGEPRLYALGFGLLAIVYFVSYFFLTKPWW